jgi:hypothetical protein
MSRKSIPAGRTEYRSGSPPILRSTQRYSTPVRSSLTAPACGERAARPSALRRPLLAVASSRWGSVQSILKLRLILSTTFLAQIAQ